MDERDVATQVAEYEKQLRAKLYKGAEMGDN